ncbi:MerR HTH family regulatory protein [Pseudarthrobacter equi]|jgi:DNA-binding transcriptional MerR regulator|uniref:MerR HTH family regulatory protein n=1 Tax=Pseudarthrobacter equi TaxID=728066 RepID=A0A1H2BGL1_9MICC|nr:MerR family transcriptional regulator [Pseudarthrobacter equi]SDT57162.1 MerR HTH family regulatory protein [Pseudarthrobacter equi]
MAEPQVPPSARPGSTAVYAISVAARLTGTGQQNIRLYETKGLLTPARTSGGTRQYSEDDIAVLLRIGELLEQGLNLAGVAMVLELEAANLKLHSALKRARQRPSG